MVQKHVHLHGHAQHPIYTQIITYCIYTNKTAIKSGDPPTQLGGMVCTILRYTFVHEVALLCTSWPQERGGNWFVATTSQVNWLYMYTLHVEDGTSHHQRDRDSIPALCTTWGKRLRRKTVSTLVPGDVSKQDLCL